MSVSCCLQTISRQKDQVQEEFIKQPEQTSTQAQNNNNNNETKAHPADISGVSPDNASGSSGKSLSENNADSGHPDSPDDDGLGPLPPNWEKAYTDKGEPYFIDHNSGIPIFSLQSSFHLLCPVCDSDVDKALPSHLRKVLVSNCNTNNAHLPPEITSELGRASFRQTKRAVYHISAMFTIPMLRTYGPDAKISMQIADS